MDIKLWVGSTLDAMPFSHWNLRCWMFLEHCIIPLGTRYNDNTRALTLDPPFWVASPSEYDQPITNLLLLCPSDFEDPMLGLNPFMGLKLDNKIRNLMDWIKQSDGTWTRINQSSHQTGHTSIQVGHPILAIYSLVWRTWMEGAKIHVKKCNMRTDRNEIT